MRNATAWQGAESVIKYGVHLGVWTNWSRGRIFGATLTLRRTDGNYLLAFTSLFVTLVSACFWAIARRALHRFYSNSAPRDALYHQRQAVFRNASSAFESLQILCSLAWAWRNSANGRRCLFRLMPGILAAAFVAVAFGVASGLSSQISSAIGTQVRLDGTNCSLVNLAAEVTESDIFFAIPYFARTVSNHANYAQQCYSTDSSGMLNCASFVRPTLPSIVDTQAPCPFASGLCRSNNSNIRLDTGYIDSNDDLGINAPANERILFRAVLSCAPLSTEGFSMNITTETGNYTLYIYGNQTTGQNYTYKGQSVQKQYADVGLGYGRGATFGLVPFLNKNSKGSTSIPSSSFQAAPDLFPRDGDILIIFLSGNGIRFQEPMNDIWYRATVPTEPILHTVYPPKLSYSPAYQPDLAASPMACLQQYQFCDVSESRCGPLASLEDAQTKAAELLGISVDAEDPFAPPENDPVSRFYWFAAMMFYSVPDMDTILRQLGASSLVSIRSLFSGVMGRLAHNQWQVDVMHWWSIYLAGIQAGAVSTASGPILEPSQEKLLIKPYTKWIKDHICNNQIILSSDYTSFSLFGLYFLYICGLIIIIASFSLEPVLDYLSDGCHRGAYSYLEWASTETLQLQRMAFQGVKSGTWSGRVGSIPTTTPAGEIMASLPFEYPLSQVFTKRPASKATIREATGTSVPTPKLEASISPPKSLETQDNLSGGGKFSPSAPTKPETMFTQA